MPRAAGLGWGRAGRPGDKRPPEPKPLQMLSNFRESSLFAHPLLPHSVSLELLPGQTKDLQDAAGSKVEFRSHTDEIGSGCHFLPHFNPDTNADADLIGYEYKTDSLNPDSDPDTFSIGNIELS